MDSLFHTPLEIVRGNINGSVNKASTRPVRLFFLAILAGVFIALGAQSSSVAMHNISDVGLSRTLGGCIFPVGLMMIVLTGGELFTGDCMLTMAVWKKKISPWAMVRTLALVFFGNMAGAVLMAGLVFFSGQLDYTSGALGAFTIKVAAGKVNLAFGTALVSGILCNILVCVAVLMAASAKDAAGKVLAVFFPILAFVVSGFEHCVANMYYIPAGIFAASRSDYLDKAVELYGLTAEQLSALNIGGFFLNNLLPVTIGNIIGGGILVAGMFFYLHGKDA